MKELTLEEFDEYIADLVAKFKEERKLNKAKKKDKENDNRNIPNNDRISN